MPERNPEIQRIFEITDDALQGLLGFHLFVDAAVGCAPDTGIRSSLPREQIWITPDWYRYYDREELLLFMRRWFTPIIYRNLFVALVSYFDAAIQDFLEHLLKMNIPCGFNSNDMKSYKKRLEWVYVRVQNSKFGTPHMPDLIPKCCLQADHARRLRNIIMHNQGLFDQRYGEDYSRIDQILEDSSLIPLFDQAFDQFRANPSARIPTIITYGGFSESLKYHVRLLHLLHNEIQFQYFKYPTGYHYGTEKKPIEWHRVFFGV